MTDGRDIWLKAGHEQFAKHGEAGLKIDTLSQITGKSRSSFYHLFGDMENFMDELIKYALAVTKQFSEEAKGAQVYFPDYINIVLKYKDMIFFNRYLFLGYDSNEKYRAAWDIISETTEDKTEELWMKMINLEDLNPQERERFYKTIRSSAYMRMEYDNFTYENLYKNVTDINRSFGFLLDE